MVYKHEGSVEFFKQSEGVGDWFRNIRDLLISAKHRRAKWFIPFSESIHALIYVYNIWPPFSSHLESKLRDILWYKHIFMGQLFNFQLKKVLCFLKQLLTLEAAFAIQLAQCMYLSVLPFQFFCFFLLVNGSFAWFKEQKVSQ